MKKNECRLKEMWVTIKNTNMCIMRVPEGEEKEKVAEKIFEENMAECYPNLTKQQ